MGIRAASNFMKLTDEEPCKDHQITTLQVMDTSNSKGTDISKNNVQLEKEGGTLLWKSPHVQ